MEANMNRLSMVVFSAAVIFLSMAMPCFASDSVKIGVVDFQRILGESSPGKLAKTEINKKGKEMEDALKTKGNEIEELKKKLEREALVMSNEKQEEKKRAIRIMVNDFKTMKNNFMREFKGIEARLVNKIKKNVLILSQEFGKNGGYTLILEKNEAGAMYVPKAIDITDALIEAYNNSAVESKPE